MTITRIRPAIAPVLCLALIVTVSCSKKPARARVFPTPEEAARALDDAARAGGPDALLDLLGPDATDLVASSDPATARRNRDVFRVAFAERWALVDAGPDRKALEIGKEHWPFPVPITHDAEGWRFDVAAGREEILDRRIGRNELAAIRLCDTYVFAQRLYAVRGHDGLPAGLYAAKFRSDPGTENGLFWPATRGGRRSPLGPVVAEAAESGTHLDATDTPQPFHGYNFRILTAQQTAAAGRKDYLANGRLTGGFALVAWPATYGVTGIMTFIVNQDGVVYQTDLGESTATDARAMSVYNPDSSWERVQ